jgi:hypothetical protein
VTHPAGLPDLFLDRSLGRRQVPELLRAAGLRLNTLAEVYGVPDDETVTDVDWLARAGMSGWAVLMKDSRIRYRTFERNALVAHQVRAFCLAGGNLRAAEMAQIFIEAADAMAEACAEPGPFLAVVTAGGALRQVPLI